MTIGLDRPDRRETSTSTSGVSFDDILGPPTGRYFAAGYKRVQYDLRDGGISHTASAITTFDASGVVSYPVDWSLGADGLPRPRHLSSVDALVLGVAALERVVSRTPDLRRAGSGVIDRVSIRSAARPVTDLTEVPVSASVEGGDSRLSAAVRVGGLRVDIGLRAADDTERKVGDVRPYWEGYRHTETACRLAAVDRDERSILTTHVVRMPQGRAAVGIESTLWPGLTHIDNVTLFGQIAQVLAQTTADIPRGSIDNLWMRRMAFTRTATSASERFIARARIVEHSVITRGGAELHSLNMEASSDHGVDATALFGFVTRSP